MNKKKSWLFILSFIIIIICISAIVIYWFNKSTDKSTLIEKSLSKQYKRNTQIKIFDTYKILDYEIVGFTIAGSQKCSYAVMKQEGNSRYELISATRPEKLINRNLDIFYDYITLVNEKNKQGAERCIVVLSVNANFSKIKNTLDSDKPIYKEITTTPSLTVLDYPVGTSKAEFLFYDKAGNLIE